MYFGKDCNHFVKRHGIEEDKYYDEESGINICNHPNNESLHEGNCNENMCPIGLSIDDFYETNDKDNTDYTDSISKAAIDGVDIVSAKDARKSVDSGKYSKAIVQLQNIKKDIDDAISAGKTSISGNGCLEKAIKDKLESLGYKYESSTQYNDSYYSIGW
jgi:hypothetical protein